MGAAPAPRLISGGVGTWRAFAEFPDDIETRRFDGCADVRAVDYVSAGRSALVPGAVTVVDAAPFTPSIVAQTVA